MPCKNHPMTEEKLTKCGRCRQTFCPDCVVELKGQFYCADCKGETVKDLQSGVEHGQLELASIGARFAAVFLDGLILAIPVFGIAFVLAMVFLGSLVATGGSNIVFELVIGVIAAIPYVLYEGFMLSSRGQTLGKMALKIKVVTPEGNDITPGQAWSRTLVRALFNQLRLLGIINYLFAFGQAKTALHDRIAKTRVVKWER